jgi:conjugative transfer pilus assembly protein TraH
MQQALIIAKEVRMTKPYIWLKRKFIQVIISILLNFLTMSSSIAGLDGLMQYVSPEGSMSNVNTPAIIKDQSGGYMTGGSILLRGPRPKELSPLNIQTPKLKFDACTGSGDFRFGAMSYISATEFNDFLKGVARASGAYLVKMSIKTACPQCEDIMTYLETVARDINSLTMNQCAMAQSLAAGAFSKLASREKQHCMMESNAANRSNDMFDTTKTYSTQWRW